MPKYKDNAQNRKLNRVGKYWGTECSPCEAKKASSPKKAPEKSIEDYTDEALRKGAKNWAKVNEVKIKGISNLSRKGLLSLFKKEKVSIDFLKFNIRKSPVYTSTMSGTKQKSGGQGSPTYSLDTGKKWTIKDVEKKVK